MTTLPDLVKRGSIYEYFLSDYEMILRVVLGYDLADGSYINIYRVHFDPEYTYNSGYIYVVEDNLGMFSRSVKYFRTSEEAGSVALQLYGDKL